MIGKYVSELLYDHECVIVPGLGGFLSSYAPAQIHPVTHRLSPPFKQLAFNANLSGNDGLLVNHIAQTQGISFHTASIQVNEWVDKGIRAMSAGGKILIENVGSLKFNTEGNIQFDRSGSVNYLEDSFGLPTFVAHPLVTIRQIGSGKAGVHAPDIVNRRGKLRQLVGSTAKWAAVLAPFIAFTVWGFSNHEMIGSLSRNYSGMFAWSNSTPGKSATVVVRSNTPLADETVYNSPESFILKANPEFEPSVFPYQSLKSASVAIDYSEESAPSLATTASSPVYHVIAGAFRSEANAGKLMNEMNLQGFPASVIGTTQHGLILVGMKGYPEKQAAVEIQSRLIKSGYESAWLLKE